MASMVKQAQKMQKKMLEAQNKLALVEVTGTSGGGAVKAVLNGQQEFKRIVIDPEFIAETFGLELDKIDADDVELLQDSILAALHDAAKQAQDLAQDEMGSVTGGLKIPGLF